MIRKISSPYMGTFLGTMVLVMAFAVIPVKADDGMKKDMMGEKPMMKGSDSMMADTIMKGSDAMTDDKEMMEKKDMMGNDAMMNDSDSMMADTIQMMDSGSAMGDDGGKMMK